MRTVGRHIPSELPALHPSGEALARAGAHMATLFAIENRVLIPRGVYRQTHAEANQQMDEAIVKLMALNSEARRKDRP